MTALIDTGQIAELLGVGSAAVLKYAKKPGFPLAVARGQWERDAVLRWFMPDSD